MSDDSSQKRTLRDRFRLPTEKAARRQFFVRAGIVVLALLVFIILPGYISSRPQFMERYDQVDTEYKTWASSVHALVPCQSCHVPPTFVAQTAYRTRMLGEFYLSLVMPGRQPKLFAKPTNAACSNCHLDLRTVSPSGDLKIPHRAHVTVLKLKCVRCHQYLVHQKSPEGRNRPPMSGCLQCHDGKTAKNQCDACHTDKVRPLSHRAPDWLIVHADKQGETDCAKCHKVTEHWCAECHAKKPASHKGDWRGTHGARVKGRRNCETCHTAAFCTKCHGEVPQLNFDPARTQVQ